MTSLSLYLVLLSAIGLERLFEMALSRRNAQRAFARGGVEVGRGHFVIMAAMHGAFLLSCAVEPWMASRAFPGALGFVALAVVAASQALRYWAIAALGERWNVRIVVVPDAAPVTSGPYRFVRHPNYLAVVLEIAAIPLVHGAYLTAAAFTVANALVLAVRIRSEEAALGSAWAARFREVPRFLPSRSPR